MRIAYVTETFPPEINGVSLAAERTVRHLRQAGHQVQLVRPRQPGEGRADNREEWRTPGGPIPLCPERRYGRCSVSDLRRRWRRLGVTTTPELVHVATPGPLAWAALRAARQAGIPCSADFRTHVQALGGHPGPGWFGPLVLGWLRRLHGLADATFVPTPEMAAQLQSLGFERLQVVGRGVDAERFSPAWRDDWLRREWHARGTDPVLLYVGRLAPEKNAPLALETFEKLRRTQRSLRMVVVGDGPLRHRLEAEHPRARFVGTLRGSELSRHYASADVLLFPSLTETFGSVTLEALASGLSVVAFDTAAAGQHLRNGVNGWLAPADGSAPGREAFIAQAHRALGAARPTSPLGSTPDGAAARLGQRAGAVRAAAAHAGAAAGRPDAAGRAGLTAGSGPTGDVKTLCTRYRHAACPAAGPSALHR